MKNKNNRIPELDLAKNIGILLVVVGHILRMYTDDGLIKPLCQSMPLSLCCNFIYSFHMPLFVFLSGLTYGHVEKNYNLSFSNFMRKKALRLMLPYFVFGFFYVAPFMVLFGYRLNAWDYLIDGIILGNDCRHLWYVWMLFNIFAIVFLVRKYSVKYNLTNYASIILLFIISIIGSKCFGEIKVFMIKASFTYLFYFTLGFSYTKYKKYTIAFLSTAFFAFILPISLPSTINLMARACTGISIVYSLCIIYKKTMNCTWLTYISKNSFGIYLFHPIIIYMLFHYLGDLQVSPYILSSVFFFISFSLSLILTDIVRRLGLGIIIGE